MTMLYITIAVLVLIYGAISYFNAATWNVLHVIAAFSAFFAAFAFIIFAALVLKTQTEWKSHFEKVNGEAEMAEADVEKQLHGSVLNPVTGQRESVDLSVLQGRSDMNRMLHARGRIWRNCQHGQIANGTVGVTLSLPTDPTDPNAAAPVPSFDPTQQSIVYVFNEVMYEGNIIPEAYVGQFMVTGVNGQNVTLKPSYPNDKLMNKYARLTKTWAIYDQMPIDNVEAFSDELEAEHGNRDDLVRIFNSAFIIDASLAEAKDRILSEFQRHGSKDPADLLPTDSDNTKWYVLKFLRDHTIQVDTQDQTEKKLNFETVEGFAAAEDLKQGHDTEFKKGDISSAIFDKETADQLEADKIAEKIETVYKRPMHDFSSEFQYAHGKALVLSEEFAALTLSQQELEKANSQGQSIKAYRETEIGNLKTDLGKIVYEKEQVTKLREQRTAQLEQVLSINSKLYRSNQALLEELTKVHQKQTDLINQNSEEATVNTSLLTEVK